MPFSAMIKLKLKFFKSTQNKITNSIFYFSFILDSFFLKKEKDYMTQKQFNSEQKKKKKKKKEEKRKDKKKTD